MIKTIIPKLQELQELVVQHELKYGEDEALFYYSYKHLITIENPSPELVNLIKKLSKRINLL